MELSDQADSARVEFRRGPPDYAKIVFVYGLAWPMTLGFVGLLLAVLASTIIDRAWFPVALERPAYGVALLTPSVFGVIVAVRIYRKWSIDRVAIDRHRIEWSRKGKTTEIRFEDLEGLSLESGLCSLLSRQGTSLNLRSPTWETCEIRQLLEDRAVPRVADGLRKELEAGRTLCYSADSGNWIIYLLGGLIILGVGVITGMLFLAAAREGPAPPQFALASIGSLGAGLGMMRRLYQTWGHRVELDARGIRFFSLPRWRRIPWSQLRSVVSDGEGVRVQGPYPMEPVRIDRDVENFHVVCRLIDQLKCYREDDAEPSGDAT